MRIGSGFDTHRLEAGRRFVVGGIEIEFDRGPAGHSDGDVLLHAVTDALLGAVGLGDIGEWFPDTDEKWSGADSAVFLSRAVEEVRRQGWQVVNLDCTVFVERPKLKPYKADIRNRLAGLLGVAPERVNIKAKTGEGVGPIGRQEAVSAHATVLLERGSGG